MNKFVYVVYASAGAALLGLSGLTWAADAPATDAHASIPDIVGTYELGPGQIRAITADGAKLFVERKGKKERLFPETSDLFFRKDVEGRILFRADAAGKIDALIDRRNNEDVVWKKIK